MRAPLRARPNLNTKLRYRGESDASIMQSCGEDCGEMLSFQLAHTGLEPIPILHFLVFGANFFFVCCGCELWRFFVTDLCVLASYDATVVFVATACPHSVCALQAWRIWCRPADARAWSFTQILLLALAFVPKSCCFSRPRSCCLAVLSYRSKLLADREQHA